MKVKTKKNPDKRTLAAKKTIIIFSVLVCIAVLVLHSAYINVREIEKQVKQNLEDVAKQNAAILEAKIDAKYQLLFSLAKELDGVTEETIEEKLDEFEIFMESFHLKRFAICFPGGTTYSTDGEVTNLAYREFYQRGMEGKSSITGVLSDALQEEHTPVNVMTIPVFDEAGEVTGVFGFTYDTDVFNESLQIESFGGQGYSCIINEKGEILSAMGTNGLELSQNLIEDALKADERNEQAIEELRNRMERGEDGSGVIYLSEKLYYYIVPVDLMDGSVTWYILTIVPSEVMLERLSTIQENQSVTVVLVMLLVVLGAMMIVIYSKEQHRRMIRFAYEDAITKGPNYTKFHADMEQKSDRRGYLISMDIANFNNISIAAGAASEELMIKETWEIISGLLKKEELAAHVKDDMFLLFLLEHKEAGVLERMEQISERISEKAKDFAVYGIHARYGMCQVSEKETLESAYSKVKLAREYAVLRQGADYAFYDETTRVRMQHEKQLEDRFPEAIEQNEFEVWYQPKYSAKECSVVGSEALVRWKNEQGKMISPGEFIPLFERNGMIVKLDEYMFRSVCRQQKVWLEEGKEVYPVSVNISRASLYSMDLHKRYQSIMQECGIDPKYIQLEVTETVMREKADICEFLNKFRDMGIKILMDDFGTGYSSLATLSLQCFDTLKLDKTLIDHIGNKDGETMLYHIIRMGQQMGLHITAEGVEQQEQLAFLQHMECDDIQGYYFSKPVPKKEYEKIIS